MRLIKSIIPLFFTAIVCISLFSCSEDNPVSPGGVDTTLDSPRFNSKVYRLGGSIYYNGVWARDTNDIFVGSSTGGFDRILNGSLSSNSFEDRRVLYVGGFDKNDGYIICTEGHLKDTSYLTIKKWNGSWFTDIPVNNNVRDSYSYCHFSRPGYIWILNTASNNTYRFDGTSLSAYPIDLPNDSMAFVRKIYYDSTTQNERALVWTNLGHAGGAYRIFYVYDFTGSGWNKTGEFSLPDFHTSQGYIDPKYINGYLLTADEKDINIYNNSGFTPLTRTHGFDRINALGGYSRNNIFVCGFQNNFPDRSHFFFHWNGKKWSREIAFFTASGIAYTINENFYIMVDNGPAQSYLQVFTRKQF